MKPLNTLPIEQFLEKSRIASKTNQKYLNLDIKEVQNLADCLALVMTRLAGNLDQNNQNQPENISIKIDGGGFR
jgi:hypothetical protein